MDYATRYLGKTVTVKIDRPMGSHHPELGFVYPVNYGFVAGTEAPDGEEVDAYVLGPPGPVEVFTGQCIAIIQRNDDDDDKLVLAPPEISYSDEEITALTNFQERYFDAVIVRE